VEKILQRVKLREIRPPKGHVWSLSNLREYLSALLFLKLCTKVHRSFYLIANGIQLKAIARIQKEELSEKEGQFFTRILFENERFLKFLRLFTDGLNVSNPEQFVSFGKGICLREKHVRPRAEKLFGYYDKREFSEKGVFQNWAVSIGILEIDREEGTYFPTYHHEIPQTLFLNSLCATYMKIRDYRTLRAEVYRVRSRVCKELKIPNCVFDKHLERLNNKFPHIISLERAPVVSFGSPKYGLTKENGETYYYLRIRGELNEFPFSSERENIRD
jgi:hypothetical protein